MLFRSFHSLCTTDRGRCSSKILPEDYLDFRSGSGSPHNTIQPCLSLSPSCTHVQARAPQSFSLREDWESQPSHHGIATLVHNPAATNHFHYSTTALHGSDHANGLFTDLTSEPFSSTVKPTVSSVSPLGHFSLPFTESTDLAAAFSLLPSIPFPSVSDASMKSMFGQGLDSGIMSSLSSPYHSDPASGLSTEQYADSADARSHNFPNPFDVGGEDGQPDSTDKSQSPNDHVAPSPSDKSSAPKPSSANHSRGGCDPSRIEKRKQNTLAARRYRQKRVDQMSSLESALKETQSERDALKVRVARLEGEVETLRQLLRS